MSWPQLRVFDGAKHPTYVWGCVFVIQNIHLVGPTLDEQLNMSRVDNQYLINTPSRTNAVWTWGTTAKTLCVLRSSTSDLALALKPFQD